VDHFHHSRNVSTVSWLRPSGCHPRYPTRNHRVVNCANLFVSIGSLAAAFQAFMYGGFTPAGGIFATLTSMAMLGTLARPVATVAISIATLVAGTVWICGLGT
jgi:hypothetical protein